ncbi:MAG: hypothetical protein LBV08_01040 [Clostridiales bacterium]|jgi:CRISPR-associated protein (TIGR03984 family)|nr:hypothetical protein [Clostridiales bacterium]
MKIDYDRIKEVFPEKAWVYAEQYDEVKIGKWDGNGFMFYSPINEDLLLMLRVFDKTREIKFSGDRCRDTEAYKAEDFIQDSELIDAKYYMYGEQKKYIGEYTKLWESRGGAIYFPEILDFPKNANCQEGAIALKLGIKNFVRYNPVPVWKKEYTKAGLDYSEGLGKTGAGALEVVDYAYTEFYYADDKETEVGL